MVESHSSSDWGEFSVRGGGGTGFHQISIAVISKTIDYFCFFGNYEEGLGKPDIVDWSKAELCSTETFDFVRTAAAFARPFL